jgi:hypothetical protein
MRRRIHNDACQNNAMQESQAEQCLPESKAESVPDENTAAGCEKGSRGCAPCPRRANCLPCRLVRYTYNCGNWNARRIAGAGLEVYRPPPQRESQQKHSMKGEKQQ